MYPRNALAPSHLSVLFVLYCKLFSQTASVMRVDLEQFALNLSKTTISEFIQSVMLR